MSKGVSGAARPTNVTRSWTIEAEKRTLEFIRKNAKADKPFFVSYWPNFLNFLEPEYAEEIGGGAERLPAPFQSSTRSWARS